MGVGPQKLESTSPPLLLPFPLLQAVTAARDKLLTVVRDRLDAASRAGDHEAVVRFVRLHKPLGVQADGLAWFAAYLRKLVADRAVEAYNVLLEAQNRSGADFVTALTDLFRDIGGALDANRAVVAETYGPAAVLDLARALHEECDAHGARILQRYCEHRRLRQLVAAAVAAASPEKARAADEPAPPRADPRQVEEYLEEVLVLYQRCEEYNAYLLAAMAAAVAPDPLGAAREQAVRSGEFNVTVRELVSNYINLVRVREVGEGSRLGWVGRPAFFSVVWGRLGRAARPDPHFFDRDSGRATACKRAYGMSHARWRRFAARGRRFFGGCARGGGYRARPVAALAVFPTFSIAIQPQPCIPGGRGRCPGSNNACRTPRTHAPGPLTHTGGVLPRAKRAHRHRH